MGIIKNGNLGVALKGIWNNPVPIFSFVFPAFPLITLNAEASGSLAWSVTGSSTMIKADLNGKIILGCKLKAGTDIVSSFTGGVEGIIVSASGSAIIEEGKVTKNFSIIGGNIYAYLDKTVLGKKERVAQETMYKGW